MAERSSTIDLFLDTFLGLEVKYLALSPDFYDTPQLLLDVVCRAFVCYCRGLCYDRSKCVHELVLSARFRLLDDLCQAETLVTIHHWLKGCFVLPFAKYIIFSLLLAVESFSLCIHSCAVRSACLLCIFIRY